VRKAVAIIDLELDPPTDGPAFCVDEQTGIGVREPAGASQPPAASQPATQEHPARPGRPARREFEYVRHGTVDLLAAFGVNDGRRTAIVRPSIARGSSASCWTVSTARRRRARRST
jgi:hypothetical protein